MRQQDNDDGGEVGVWHLGPTIVLGGTLGERLGNGDACGRRVPLKHCVPRVKT